MADAGPEQIGLQADRTTAQVGQPPPDQLRVPSVHQQVVPLQVGLRDADAGSSARVESWDVRCSDGAYAVLISDDGTPASVRPCFVRYGDLPCFQRDRGPRRQQDGSPALNPDLGKLLEPMTAKDAKVETKPSGLKITDVSAPTGAKDGDTVSIIPAIASPGRNVIAARATSIGAARCWTASACAAMACSPRIC